MHINIEEINRKDFNVSERIWHRNAYFLITPKKSKHKWAYDELHLRSLLVREDGKIVSSGFPKFLNYSEDPEHDRMFESYLENGEVRFAEKMDGSLIIRSIIDGHVNFRTRGSHQLAEDFMEPVMSLIRERYPRLLDTTYRAGESMLFEYTSPSNRIVLQYEDSRLTTLGVMNLYKDHTLPKFFGFKHLVDKIAEESGVDALKFHDLSTDLSELRSEIAGWIGSEGIVAWCGNGAMLIKIKADEYIKIHALKFHLTEDRIRKLAWFGDLNSVDELKNKFFEIGLDWEAVDFVREYMVDFLNEKNEVEQKTYKFLDLIELSGVTNLNSKKHKALAIKELTSDKGLRAIGFKYIAGDIEGVRNLIASKLLGIPVNALTKARSDIEIYNGESK